MSSRDQDPTMDQLTTGRTDRQLTGMTTAAGAGTGEVGTRMFCLLINYTRCLSLSSAHCAAFSHVLDPTPLHSTLLQRQTCPPDKTRLPCNGATSHVTVRLLGNKAMISSAQIQAVTGIAERTSAERAVRGICRGLPVRSQVCLNASIRQDGCCYSDRSRWEGNF
ncbi:hypothetical protein J6590_011526 [Homalodisca vitripennis]|nr:hypothetical protein J6590_011526 [Homalodisca vitripennis]